MKGFNRTDGKLRKRDGKRKKEKRREDKEEAGRH